MKKVKKVNVKMQKMLKNTWNQFKIKVMLIRKKIYSKS